MKMFVAVGLGCMLLGAGCLSHQAEPIPFSEGGCMQLNVPHSSQPGQTPDPVLEGDIPVCRATTPAERLATGWWKARLEAQEAKANRPYETVFIGDSITHDWDTVAPDIQAQVFGDVLNLGISGDKTQEVLWRIARINWRTVAPKRIVLMIGTNNTGHRPSETPENTTHGIRAILRLLRQECPQATITLLAIFPRGLNRQDANRRTNDEINARLPLLCNGETIRFLDLSALFLLPDGETLNTQLMPDRLHPNKEGHRLWAEAMAPALSLPHRPTPAPDCDKLPPR